ncbi:hypothetical protein F4780DRAFT_194315 [Xylariomycetidae sp. FL0641]|nr:hypothetical protein F4780DRAFT_194315 [Xylariomycetidae sp. FL0641]
MTADTDWASLITPDLLTYMVATFVPFEPSERITDHRAWIQRIVFTQLDDPAAVRRRVWPALRALTTIERTAIPAVVSEVLPAADAPAYAAQALGLQLLLDQAPRVLCRGATDVRWAYEHFPGLATACADALLAASVLAAHDDGQALPLLGRLPPAHPAAWEKWQGAGEVEYFLAVRLGFLAPFWHAEDPDATRTARRVTEHTRQWVERRFRVPDPYRDETLSGEEAILAFPRMLRQGGPPEGCAFHEAVFWLLRLLDVHEPILDEFERYPYANWRLGRRSTDEEIEWLRKSEVFANHDEDLARRIREDVLGHVWAPFGDEAAYESAVET